MNLLDVPPAVLEDRLEVGGRAYISYESNLSGNVVDVVGELLELDERTIRIREHKGVRTRDLLADLEALETFTLADRGHVSLGTTTYVGKSIREARGGNFSSAARYLLETDPEDFPPEEEAELVTDGGRSLAERREVLREKLDGREMIKCGLCEDSIDLSSADDGDEAVELWDEHVRDAHDQDPLDDVERDGGGELGFFVLLPRLETDRVDPLLESIARAGFKIGERNDGGDAQLVANALEGDTSRLEYWPIEDREELNGPTRRLWQAQSLVDLVAGDPATSELDTHVLREVLLELERIEAKLRESQRPRTDGGVDVDVDPDTVELRRRIGRLSVTIERLKRERDAKLDRLDELESLETDGGEDLVEACPECDASSIRRRYFRQVDGGLEEVDDAERWVCYKNTGCGATFDEPNRRPRRRSTTAEKLGNLDPDEVTITDGGEPHGGGLASELYEARTRLEVVIGDRRTNPDEADVLRDCMDQINRVEVELHRREIAAADGGEDQETDVSVHLDDETTIDPERTFRERAERSAECSHPPEAVEPFGKPPEGVGEEPEGYACTECYHVLDGQELEDRGIVDHPGDGNSGGIR